MADTSAYFRAQSEDGEFGMRRFTRVGRLAEKETCTMEVDVGHVKRLGAAFGDGLGADALASGDPRARARRLRLKPKPILYVMIGKERTFELDGQGPTIEKREIVRPGCQHVVERGTGLLGLIHERMREELMIRSETAINARELGARSRLIGRNSLTHNKHYV